MPSRLALLALLIALGGAAFLVRLFQLQVLEGSLHAQAVERSLIMVEPLPARRGRILDRTGTAMAETKPMYHLAVVLAELEVEGAPAASTICGGSIVSASTPWSAT